MRSRKGPILRQKCTCLTNTAYYEKCGFGMYYKKSFEGYMFGNYNKHGIKKA